LFSFGCIGQQSVSETNEETSSLTGNQPDSSSVDENLVYGIVINEFYAPKNVPYVVLNQTTTYHLPYEDLHKSLIALRDDDGFSELSDVLIANFEERNKHSVDLLFLQKINPNISFVSKEELDDIFGDDIRGWSKFGMRYPGENLVQFSRVAFNADRSEALIYTNQTGGPKSGQGNYVFLEKTNGKWTIEMVRNYWVS
jgi:hypothetical protein